MSVDNILRDGRQISELEVNRAKELEELGLCSIEVKEFVECVHPDDDDYDNLREHRCDQSVNVTNLEGSTCECPGCRRTIYIDQKEVREKKFIGVNQSGIREYVRDLCNDVPEYTAHKRRSPVKMLDEEFPSVNSVELDNFEVEIIILCDRIPGEIFAIDRITGDNILWLLVDDAVPLQQDIHELGLHSVTIGGLLAAEDGSSFIEEQLQPTVQEGQGDYLDIAARSAINLCSSRSSLEKMGWSEFEHCVQTLLQASIRTSYLFGAVERGSGEPDGAITLHWSEDSLFMWDAKFVNLEENSETSLSGEYDKIFRHLQRMDGQERLQRDYGGVSGIILFTPGINEANVSRLAETIHQREMSSPDLWEGSVVYFELEALLELAISCLENRASVRQKPNLFRQALHVNLTSPSKHQDDPEKVFSSDYKSLHMSVQDIKDIFGFLRTQDSEANEFNRAQYLQAAEYFRDI